MTKFPARGLVLLTFAGWWGFHKIHDWLTPDIHRIGLHNGNDTTYVYGHLTSTIHGEDYQYVYNDGSLCGETRWNGVSYDAKTFRLKATSFVDEYSATEAVEADCPVKK